MQVQLINNQFDSDMKSKDFDKSMQKRLVECVNKPIIINDKANIPQWKFCTVKGTKRCTENMDSTNILILDYDDSNYTYKEFEHQFQEFQYILHTSYSYTGTNSKFRVLLFLDKEYEIDRMFCKLNEHNQLSPYHLLLTYFQHVDPASFVKAQFFKVPAIASENAPYYKNIHSGKLFNLFENIVGYEMGYNRCKDIEKQQHKESIARAAVKRTQFNGDLTRAIEYVKRKMEEAPSGMRHNCIFGLAAWFSKVGGDYYTFSQIRPSWADKKYDNQIKRLQKEWDKIGR